MCYRGLGQNGLLGLAMQTRNSYLRGWQLSSLRPTLLLLLDLEAPLSCRVLGQLVEQESWETQLAFQ